MDNQLFEGKLVRLTAYDPETDAETEARWTENPDFLRLTELDPVRPLSAHQVKKERQQRARRNEESRRAFDFSIRLTSENRLAGYARLENIDWSNGAAQLVLAIGDPADWSHCYGGEALQLMLRYAFHELNLHRLGAPVFEYNERGRRMLERAGFREEVRRRQFIHRDGKRWDLIRMGLLRAEWECEQTGRSE
jgi:RimJ/RimL family protein N-acetyltransferase